MLVPRSEQKLEMTEKMIGNLSEKKFFFFNLWSENYYNF